MKKFTLLLSLVLVLSLGIGFFGNSVHANDKDDHDKIMCYRSIEIQKGDTLWSIAEDNLDVEYDTVTTYVDNLMKINNLVTDEIGSGNYLTIYYYETN